ncbi:MAG: hypothetical protein RL753_823 [Bacteroidota bacterium]
MKRFCLALDLIDDAESIRVYEAHHAPGAAWPEVTQHDIDCGILNIEIFRTGNRMFMILETVDDFTFEKKAEMDAANPGSVSLEEVKANLLQRDKEDRERLDSPLLLADDAIVLDNSKVSPDELFDQAMQLVSKVS